MTVRDVTVRDIGLDAAAKAEIRRQRDLAVTKVNDEAHMGPSFHFGGEFQAALSDLEVAEARVEKFTSGVHVRSEPLTYSQWTPHRSFFRDMIAVQEGRRGRGTDGAADRLERHRVEMELELQERRKRDATRYERATAGAFEARIAPDRTPGTGGEFVAPLWLQEDWTPVARAGRPLGSLCRSVPLPGWTDAINVPTFLSGSYTGALADDQTAIGTDATTGSARSQVATIVGRQIVSQQLIDQAPTPGFDAIVWSDLLLDYDAKLEAQLIAGSGTGAQLLGLLNVPGNITLAYTDATPTGPKLLTALAQAAAQMGDARLLPPEVFLMATRRWFWLAAQPDAQSRPLLALGAGPLPDTSQVAGGVPGFGPVLGLPSYCDGAMPLNLGAGTNQDPIVITRPSDHLLFESEPTLRVMTGTAADALGVHIDMYRYAAFIGTRFPASTAVVNGTGTIGPTGY